MVLAIQFQFAAAAQNLRKLAELIPLPAYAGQVR
jgi:hypothetical protein